MNVLAWLHCIVALVYPSALPDTSGSSVSRTEQHVVRTEGMVQISGSDSIDLGVAPNGARMRVSEPSAKEHGLAEDAVGALVAITFFLVIGAVVWKRIDSDKKLRLALIERGLDPSTLKGPDSTKRFGALRFGMMLVGTSIGLLTGFLLNSFSGDRIALEHHEFVVLMTTLFFTGMSLILYHMIAASLNRSL